jgi:hypothetical protein
VFTYSMYKNSVCKADRRVWTLLCSCNTAYENKVRTVWTQQTRCLCYHWITLPTLCPSSSSSPGGHWTFIVLSSMPLCSAHLCDHPLPETITPTHFFPPWLLFVHCLQCEAAFATLRTTCLITQPQAPQDLNLHNDWTYINFRLYTPLLKNSNL